MSDLSPVGEAPMKYFVKTFVVLAILISFAGVAEAKTSACQKAEALHDQTYASDMERSRVILAKRHYDTVRLQEATDIAFNNPGISVTESDRLLNKNQRVKSATEAFYKAAHRSYKTWQAQIAACSKRT